jgi:hypothetical protein
LWPPLQPLPKMNYHRPTPMPLLCWLLPKWFGGSPLVRAANPWHEGQPRWHQN